MRLVIDTPFWAAGRKHNCRVPAGTARKMSHIRDLGRGGKPADEVLWGKLPSRRLDLRGYKVRGVIRFWPAGLNIHYL